MSTKTKKAAAGKDTRGELVAYTYRARGADGRVVTGQVRARTRVEVNTELAGKGLIPLKVSQKRAFSLDGEVALRRGVPKRELVVVTRQLASMFEAGLTHVESLEVAIRGCKNPNLRTALTATRAAVAGGEPMATALAAHPNVFSDTVVNLIAAGERSGKLKDAMYQVAEQMDTEERLASKVQKALIGPAIQLVATVIAAAIMVIFLVPRFTTAYEEMAPGRDLPLITRGLITISHWSVFVVPALIVAGMLAASWYRKHRREEKVRDVVDRFKLRIPVLGKLFRLLALGRFTRTLAGLEAAGVDRIEALTITSRTVGNMQLERAILNAREAQRNGSSLAEPLSKEPLFDPMAISMIETGEKSGRTAVMLGRAADLYTRDSEKMADNLAQLLNPFLVVFMGIVVGGLVAAMYWPYLALMLYV